MQSISGNRRERSHGAEDSDHKQLTSAETKRRKEKHDPDEEKAKKPEEMGCNAENGKEVGYFATPATPSGFPMAIVLHSSMERPRSMTELAIQECSAAIRDVPKWSDRINVDSCSEVVTSWKEDARGRIQSGSHNACCSQSVSAVLEQAWPYALQECRYLSNSKHECRLSAVDHVYGDDYAQLSSSKTHSHLGARLHQHLSKLRASLGEDADRHPHFPCIVNLVHPSLYAFQAKRLEPVLMSKDQSMRRSYGDRIGKEWRSVRGEAGIGDASTVMAPPFEKLLGSESCGPVLQHRFTRYFSSPVCSETFISARCLQWLPSEFHVSDLASCETPVDDEMPGKGLEKRECRRKRCKINSYINSLHPEENASLYHDLEDLFLLALPLLERALSEVSHVAKSPHCSPSSPAHSPAAPVNSPDSEHMEGATSPHYSPGSPAYSPTSPTYSPASPAYSPASPIYSPDSTYDALPPSPPSSPGTCPASPSATMTNLERRHGSIRERLLRVPIPSPAEFRKSQLRGNDTPLLLPVPKFAPPECEDDLFTHQRTPLVLRNRPLQVVVKVLSMELLPGDEFPGGWWHVEGMLDDRIAATACCYLEHENLSGGDLEFRTSVQDPEQKKWVDSEWRSSVFGLHPRSRLFQPRGRCSTPPGRILAWPNTLQHRITPARLTDPSRPGRRSVVGFFLVDPTLRIPSTATVPPQQQSWVAAVYDEILAHKLREQANRRQVLDYLFQFPDSPFLSYEQACERRRLMNEERGVTADNCDNRGPDFYFFAPLIRSRSEGSLAD